MSPSRMTLCQVYFMSSFVPLLGLMVSLYRGEMASLCITRDGFAVLGYLAHHLAYKVIKVQISLFLVSHP
jgi:hypothetical protein